MTRLIQRGFWTVAILFSFGCTRSETPLRASPPVATLKNALGDLKWRSGRQLAWKQAQNGQALSNYDGIRTEAQSSGEVDFVDGAHLAIAEKSLIIILDRSADQKLSRSELALSQGGVEGTLPEASSQKVELRLRTQNGWIVASNQEDTGPHPGKKPHFSARMENGKLRVRNRGLKMRLEAKELVQDIPTAKEVIVEAPAQESVGARPEDFQSLPAIESPRIQVVEAPPEEEALSRDIPNKESKPEPESPRTIASKEPAQFELDFPKDNSYETREPMLTLKGRFPKGTDVFLNGEAVEAHANGSFRHQVKLAPGENLFTFQIISSEKQEVKYQTRKVYYRP